MEITTQPKNATKKITSAEPIIKSGFPWVNLSLGDAYRKNGEFQESLIHYHKEQKTKPHHGETMFRMGQAYAGKGDYEKAIELYQLALSCQEYEDAISSPITLATLFAYLGYALSKAKAGSPGSDGYAKKSVETAEETRRNNPDCHANYTLALCYAMQSNKKKAVESLKQAIDINEFAWLWS